jgi:hypothetical protein
MIYTSIAQDVYNQAVILFCKDYTEDGTKIEWIRDQYSVHDVLTSVEKAQAMYLLKRKSRASKWVSSLSSRIMYYSNIMDMLAQHHPEFVSLGWGTLKLLFVVSTHGPNPFK